MTKLLPMILTAAAAACSSDVPAERDLGCKGNPGVVGQCYSLQGTLNLSADAAYVLWPDQGDRRPVKIRPAAGSSRDWPENVSRALMESGDAVGIAMAWTHGTFAVCPVPSQTTDDPQGTYGCIEAAHDLTVGTEIRRN